MAFAYQKLEKFEETDLYMKRATNIAANLLKEDQNATRKLNEFMNKDVDLNLAKNYLEMFNLSYKEFDKIKKSTASKV